MAVPKSSLKLPQPVAATASKTAREFWFSSFAPLPCETRSAVGSGSGAPHCRNTTPRLAPISGSNLSWSLRAATRHPRSRACGPPASGRSANRSRRAPTPWAPNPNRGGRHRRAPGCTPSPPRGRRQSRKSRSRAAARRTDWPSSARARTAPEIVAVVLAEADMWANREASASDGSSRRQAPVSR